MIDDTDNYLERLGIIKNTVSYTISRENIRRYIDGVVDGEYHLPEEDDYPVSWEIGYGVKTVHTEVEFIDYWCGVPVFKEWIHND